MSAPASRTVRGTDTEQRLAAIWSVTLGTRHVQPHHDFFTDLGGDSLAVIDTLVGIEQAFGVRPGTHTLLEHATLQGLAAEIDRLRASETSTAATTPHSASETSSLLDVLRPATPGQPAALLIGSLPRGRPVTSVLPDGWGVTWLKLPGLHDPGRAGNWRSLAGQIQLLTSTLRTADFRPDVLVGFSFGGALAWFVAHELGWQIPTVLIEPSTPRRNQLRHFRPTVRERWREAKSQFRKWLREQGNTWARRLTGRWDAHLARWRNFRRVAIQVRLTAEAPRRDADLLLVGSSWYLERFGAAWNELTGRQFRTLQSGTVRHHDAAFHPPHDGALRAAMQEFVAGGGG